MKLLGMFTDVTVSNSKRKHFAYVMRWQKLFNLILETWFQNYTYIRNDKKKIKFSIVIIRMNVTEMLVAKSMYFFHL